MWIKDLYSWDCLVLRINSLLFPQCLDEREVEPNNHSEIRSLLICSVNSPSSDHECARIPGYCPVHLAQICTAGLVPRGESGVRG